MKKVFQAIVLATLLVAIGCAKHAPKVAPAHRPYVDLPATESGTAEVEDRMDITIPAFDPQPLPERPTDQSAFPWRGSQRSQDLHCTRRRGGV
jgi:hypothetical protein